MMRRADLRREGFRALCDRLGVAGALRFLEEYETGAGDYTAERSRILGSGSVKEIVRSIRRGRRPR